MVLVTRRLALALRHHREKELGVKCKEERRAKGKGGLWGFAPGMSPPGEGKKSAALLQDAATGRKAAATGSGVDDCNPIVIAEFRKEFFRQVFGGGAGPEDGERG